MISRIWAVGAAGVCAVAFVAGAWTNAHALGTRGPAHAMSMHGEPKYGPDFRQFDYANPDAPKGGNVVLAAAGRRPVVTHHCFSTGNQSDAR